MSETSNTELKANLNQIRSCRLAEKYREDDKERMKQTKSKFLSNKSSIEKQTKSTLLCETSNIVKQTRSSILSNKNNTMKQTKSKLLSDKSSIEKRTKTASTQDVESCIRQRKKNSPSPSPQAKSLMLCATHTRTRMSTRRYVLPSAAMSHLPFVEYCITNNNFLPQPEPATCPQRTCSLSALTYACHHLHTARSSRIVRRLLSLFPSLLIPSAQPLPHTTRSRLKILASAPDRWGKLLENG